MRKLWAIAFILAGVNCIWGQINLSGRILNEKGEGVQQAHLHIGNQYVHSDQHGNYSFTLKPGTYRIHITHIGFQDLDQTLELTSDTVLNFTLIFEVTQLSEVQLVQNRLGNKTHAQHQIRSSQLENYSQSNLADALRELSGIAMLKTGNAMSKPVINGMHSNRVLVLNNQVRMEDQSWGLEHAPNVDVNAADKVTVIKGASGLQYGGDALGGIVLVEPLLPSSKDTLFGKVMLNADSNGRGGAINAQVTQTYRSGWYYKLQSSLRHFGDFKAPDYLLTNTAHNQQGASALFGFRGHHSGWESYYSYFQSEIGILRAAHTGNLTDLYQAILGGSPQYSRPFSYEIESPKQEVRHHLAKLKYYHDWHLGRMDLQYSFQWNQRQEFDLRRANTANRAALDMDLYTHSVLLDFKSKTGSISWKTGLSGQYQSNTTHLDTGIRPLIPDFERLDFGAYALAEWIVNDNWQVEGGIRYDYTHLKAVKFYLKSRWEQLGYVGVYDEFIVGDFQNQWKTNPQFDYHNVSGNLGFRNRISEEWTSFLSLGLMNRNPNPSELFSDGLHHATGQIELGDLRLKSERAYKLSWNLLFQNQRFSMDLNPYVNRIDGFIFQLPQGLEYTTRGAFPVWYYAQTQALLTGLDATSNFSILKNLEWKSNFSWIYAQDLENKQPLPDMPPLQWRNELVWSYPDWNNLMFKIGQEFTAKQHRYPNADFMAQIVQEGQPVMVNIPISRPPKAYNLWHLSVQSEVPLFKKVQTTAVIGVRNLANLAYRDFLNRLRYYADESGRNVTFQLKFKF